MTTLPKETLLAIQRHFHEVITRRAAEFVEVQALQLPVLGALPSSDEEKEWFPVPGMYGGFAYWLETQGETAKLIVESWSRVVEGSGQRHEVTSKGSTLVDEGFV